MRLARIGNRFGSRVGDVAVVNDGLGELWRVRQVGRFDRRHCAGFHQSGASGLLVRYAGAELGWFVRLVGTVAFDGSFFSGPGF